MFCFFLVMSGSRPISRVLSRTVIHLGYMSPCSSCDLPGNSAGRTIVPLFGLAPGGVFPATDVTTSAVRSYRTFSPLPNLTNLGYATKVSSWAVYFLWHYPSAHAAQALPGTLPYGARTFLHSFTDESICELSSDCLADSHSLTYRFRALCCKSFPEQIAEYRTPVFRISRINYF